MNHNGYSVSSLLENYAQGLSEAYLTKQLFRLKLESRAQKLNDRNHEDQVTELDINFMVDNYWISKDND